MNIWVVLIVLVLLGVVLSSAANTLLKAKAAKGLMAREAPFRIEGEDYTKTMLVLGDSTGVGVGATMPEDSVAGRVAAYIGATYVENHAVSGAAVEDLPKQVSQAGRTEYDLILIHIGGNDILGFNDPKKVGPEFTRILGTLPNTEKVVVLSAGNVGGATIFPGIVRFLHTRLTLQYHDAFAEAVKGTKAVYVNLYLPPKEDPFLKHPKKYLAEDGLHPSSDGYGFWFEQVKMVL
ncbi:SGNH/GDSL hydrolase family protein [Patescibacteria group bacterium]|nr:SGNH/GDSL hydrolase family protein [Patescibacteria group bacterium]